MLRVARQCVILLLRFLLFTWLIFAYFMVRSMELKSQAERNKQELTMDMIRNFATVIGYFILTIICFLLYDNRLIEMRTSHIMAGLITVVCMIHIAITSLLLVVRMGNLRSDLDEAEAQKPSESLFLSVIYVLVATITVCNLFVACVLICLPCFSVFMRRRNQ